MFYQKKFVYWSFATIESLPGAFNSFSILIRENNGAEQAAGEKDRFGSGIVLICDAFFDLFFSKRRLVDVGRVLSLCTGSGMPEYTAQRQLVWLKFKAPSRAFVAGSTYAVTVRATGGAQTLAWTYTVRATDCAALPPSPPMATPAPTPGVHER